MSDLPKNGDHLSSKTDNMVLWDVPYQKNQDLLKLSSCVHIDTCVGLTPNEYKSSDRGIVQRKKNTAIHTHEEIGR